MAPLRETNSLYFAAQMLFLTDNFYIECKYPTGFAL